jgi:hypothetical protein
MTARLRVRYCLPNVAVAKLRTIDRGQTVQEMISFIGKMDRVINLMSTRSQSFRAFRKAE